MARTLPAEDETVGPRLAGPQQATPRLVASLSNERASATRKDAERGAAASLEEET